MRYVVPLLSLALFSGAAAASAASLSRASRALSASTKPWLGLPSAAFAL